MSEIWDRRFVALAEHVASWSKDPSKKVGAVLVSPDRDGVVIGYNGLARGLDDAPARYADRSVKLEAVVHAEVNAVVNARRDLRGWTLYVWPIPPCARCAGVIIQARVSRIVSPPPAGSWEESAEQAAADFREAGVEVVILPQEIVTADDRGGVCPVE